MRLLQSFVAVGVTSLLAAGARAADVPRLPPPLEPPPVVAKPLLRDAFATGWYLRGDFGYRWPIVSSATATTGTTLGNSSLGNDYTATIGVGVKSHWFRSDVTVDYASAFKYAGMFATPGDTTAKIQSTDILLNVYADLGTWYRLTPYIGAGVGTADVLLTNVNAPGFTGASSASRWNLAWAAMAGVGWTVAPNLLIDLGYRYLNVGDVKSVGDAVGTLTFKNIAGHEIRIGLRWSFDDLYGDR